MSWSLVPINWLPWRPPGCERLLRCPLRYNFHVPKSKYCGLYSRNIGLNYTTVVASFIDTLIPKAVVQLRAVGKDLYNIAYKVRSVTYLELFILYEDNDFHRKFVLLYHWKDTLNCPQIHSGYLYDQLYDHFRLPLLASKPLQSRSSGKRRINIFKADDVVFRLAPLTDVFDCYTSLWLVLLIRVWQLPYKSSGS